MLTRYYRLANRDYPMRGPGGGPGIPPSVTSRASSGSGGSSSGGSAQQSQQDPMGFISEQFPEVGALYQMAPGYPGMPSAGSSMQDYIESVTRPEVQEQILAAERTYGPQYAQLQLGGLEDFLMGTGGQQGFLAMQEEAAERAGEVEREQTALARQSAIESVLGLAPGYVSGMRGAQPQATGLAEAQAQQAGQLQQFATERMEAAGGLSPEERRLAQQRALSTAEAQGRVRDTSALAAELLGREEILGTRRAEALQAQQTATGARAAAFDMERGLSGNIAGTILGQGTTAPAIGQAYAGGAQMLQQQVGPQLFDPNVGVNMALQDLQNQINFQSTMFGTQASLLGTALGAEATLEAAKRQASATRSSGFLGALGSIGGGLMSNPQLFSMSDIRLKEDIEHTGYLPSGLRTYRFRYRGSDEVHEGVMAQEALLTHPRAVQELTGGFLAVDYSMID